MRSLFRMKSCVIKQGNKNMISDDNGRDIHDRLSWQKNCMMNLAQTVSLPEIYDLFQEEGDTYLVMEYINGLSLYDRMKEINFSSRSWFDLTKGNQLELLDYLLKIIVNIEHLHQKRICTPRYGARELSN